MTKTQEAAPAARDPKALWVTCPECNHEFGVPASRVFWFIDYLIKRNKERLANVADRFADRAHRE